ncbi:MAG: hypothetical protein H6648_06675 [Caldilineae bacterium]|nr:hypothetical protein [Caldilineae bacterium]
MKRALAGGSRRRLDPAPGALAGRPARWRVGLLAGLLLLLALPSRSTLAQSPELAFEVSMPWQGWFAEDAWMPLWIEVEGDRRDRDLELRALTAKASYALALELPAGARKRLPLLVWLDAADRRAGSLQVELVEARGERLAETRLALQSLGQARLSLALGGVDALPAGLEADPRQSRALTLAPEDLPEAALGWAAVDRLILGGAALDRLGDAQRTALRQWVALGGQLFLAGGAAEAGALERLPEGLRPARAGALRGVPRLSSLAALAGRAGPRGTAQLLTLSPLPGAEQPLVSDEGLPLAAQRRYGDGVVTALAFDPAAAPFLGWDGMPALWSALDLPRPGSAWREEPPRSAWMAAGIDDGRGLPPLGWALLVLGAYILLVGPLGYLLLARWRRLDLAWLAIPIVALATSGLLFGIGRGLRDRTPRLYQLTVLRALPEVGLARIGGYLALSAPDAGPRELVVPLGLARPAADPGPARLDVRFEAEGSRLRGLASGQTEPSGLALDAIVDWPAGAAPEPLRLAEGRLNGRLVLPPGPDLAEALLLTPGGREVLGDLAPGAERSVDARYAPESPIELEARGMRGHLLAAAFASGAQPPSALATSFQMRGFAHPEAVLAGWSAEPPLAPSLVGVEAELLSETLVLLRLPIGLGSSMRFVEGSATRRSPESAARCGPAGAVLTPGYDLAEFAFPLGAGRPLPYAVWLSILGPSGDALAASGPVQVRVAVWDPAAGAWLDFDRMAAGSSAQIPRLVTRQEGRDQIRLRLARDPQDGLRAWEALREQCWEPRLSIVEGAPPDGASGEDAGAEDG